VQQMGYGSQEAAGNGVICDSTSIMIIPNLIRLIPKSIYFSSSRRLQLHPDWLLRRRSKGAISADWV